MATRRHPFEVIKELGAGLDFAGLGQGAGQELSNRLNAAGYGHTFDGLDRYKFDGSGDIDTYYGTIDAIRNKGFVQGRRGAGEQELIFQPWHDRKEARAMRAMGMDLPDPDAPSGPPSFAPALGYRRREAQMGQPTSPGLSRRDPFSLMQQPGRPGPGMEMPGAQMPELGQPVQGGPPQQPGQQPPPGLSPQGPPMTTGDQTPWYMSMLKGRR